MKYRSVGEPEQYAPLHYLSGGVWKQDETYLVKRRNYAAYLLLYTIGGEGLLSYDGEEYRLTAGTAFLIDCRREQMYRTVGRQWEFVFVHFDTEVLGDYVDGLYVKHGAVFHMADGSALESCMREAVSPLMMSGSAAEHRAFGLLAEMLGMLYASAEEADRSVRISSHTVSVIRLIEERYAEKLTLDVIAQQARYSKYYLAHRFKQDMGISVYEYLTLFRIGRSKLLLLNTSLSVAEIAVQTGFAGVSNFIRTFSEYESITPHQYRKQWQ